MRHRLLRALAAFVMLTTGCGDADDSAAEVCDGAVTGQLGALDGSGPAEASGLAVSSVDNTTLWMHNDRGNPAELFAVTTAGSMVGAWPVSGAVNTDWEDLASSPHTEQLVIGDIGDNKEQRPSITLYVVDEPDPSEPNEPIAVGVAVELQYPDGPHDAEALIIDQRGGAIAVVTKGDDAGLYVAALDLTAPPADMQLRWAGTPWPGAEVRAAAMSADGSLVALRSDDHLRLWLVGDGPLDELADWPSCQIALEQRRGEALAFVGSDRLIAAGEGKRSAILEVTLTSRQ